MVSMAVFSIITALAKASFIKKEVVDVSGISV